MACFITDPKTIPLWPTWQYAGDKQGAMPRSHGNNKDTTKGILRRAAFKAMAKFWAKNGLTPDPDFTQLPTPQRILEVFQEVFPRIKDLHAIRRWK